MKRSQLSKAKQKMYTLKRAEGAPRSTMELGSVFKEMQRLREKPVLSGIKRMMTLGQDLALVKWI